MAKLLLIDDNELLRSLTVMQLKLLGHAVLECGDGEAALDIAADHAVELVLTDVHLPGMNGFDTIVELRRIRPAIKVVAMSGSLIEDQFLQMAAGAGVRHTLGKPFKLKDLEAQLVAALSEEGIEQSALQAL